MWAVLAVVVALGVLGTVFVSPLVGVALAAVVAILVAPELPLVLIVTCLLIARALVDNSGGSGTLTPTAMLAGAMTALGVALALRGRGPVLLLGAVGAVLGVSAFWAQMSVGPDAGKEYLRVLSVLAVALVFYSAKPPVTPLRAVRVVQVVAAAPAAFAVLQFVTGTGTVIDGDIRASGTIYHPNSAALFFGLALVVSVYGMGLSPRGERRITLGSILLFGAALVSTLSVGGILATTIMLVVYFMIRPGSGGLRRTSVLLLITGAFVAAAVSPLGSARLSGLFDGASASGSAVDSLDWRLNAWGVLAARVWENPIFGFGYGATTSETLLIGYIPHNEYLRSLVEMGIVGTAVIAIICVAGLSAQARRLRDERFGSAPALVFAIGVGLCVNAIAANTFLYPMPSYLMVVIFSTLGARRTFTEISLDRPASVERSNSESLAARLG